jgi:predicted nuclease with RNAse H fold
MSSVVAPEPFCIGWDVGGWNCDHNRSSRDALVILDAAGRIVGVPWRGNLRECIAVANTTGEWIRALFSLCAASHPEEHMFVTMAIDTPLGFSKEFVNLVTSRKWTDQLGSSDTNPYLFRQTERRLFRQGLTPLSAIKDMIGSQATKGMHALAKFAPTVESCGVWTDGRMLRAIETYPTASRDSQAVTALLKEHKPLSHNDLNDARVCAIVAHLFTTDRESLEPPLPNVPHSEGWIWIPKNRPLVLGAIP